MESFSIPSGFKDFLLEELDGDLCCEELEEKELALISVPADFDVTTLNGEQIVDNGCKVLDNRQPPENSKIWELHSSSICHDRHLNVLLPSKLKDKHVLADNFSMSLNIIPTMLIPTFISPKKTKVGTPLPKPCGLRTRWNPFGAGCPVARSKHKSKLPDMNLGFSNPKLNGVSTVGDGCINEQAKEKEGKTFALDSGNMENDTCTMDVTNTECILENQCVNEETKCKKEKKKKKMKKKEEQKILEVDDKKVENNESIMNTTSTNGSIIESGCLNEEIKGKKKKKKKKEEKIPELNDIKVESNESIMNTTSTNGSINGNGCLNEETKVKKKKKKKQNGLELCAIKSENDEYTSVIDSHTNIGTNVKNKPQHEMLDTVKLESEESVTVDPNTSTSVDD